VLTHELVEACDLTTLDHGFRPSCRCRRPRIAAFEQRSSPSHLVDQTLTTGQFLRMSLMLWKARGPHMQAFSVWS
jgi:hypothetical protein